MVVPLDKDRTAAVGDLKSQITLQDLFKDCPLEFMKIMDYVKRLGFKNDPDYKLIQNFIHKIA